MTLSFRAYPIKVSEIVFPPSRIVIPPSRLLVLKNTDYHHMLIRNDEFWDSVASRIKQWESYVGGTADINAQDRGQPPLGTATMGLRTRLEHDRSETTALIHSAYGQSSPADTLAFGPVRTATQNKVVLWDNEFERMEKAYFSFRNYFATDKELRKLTGANFKRVYEFLNGGAPSSISEAEGRLSMPVPQASRPPATPHESGNEADAPSEASLSEAELKQISVPVEGEKPAEPRATAETIVDAATKSDGGESDSTIGATRSHEGAGSPPKKLSVEESIEKLIDSQDTAAEPEDTLVLASRLPRRAKVHPSVADLVRQFQAEPAPVDIPLSTSPTASIVSESDQEIEVPARRRPRSKGPTRGLQGTKRPGSPAIRDRSTAAARSRNIRQVQPLETTGSRIPVPVLPSEPVGIARRNGSISRRMAASPSGNDSASTRERFGKSDDLGGRTSAASRLIKGSKPTKGGSRPTTPTIKVRGAARKLAPPPGSKVSSIARQFERISRDNEKANRRYAIMKGNRARPVAQVKAEVKVFDNIMDAARDDSDDGSEASSEADDEDEGDDEAKKRASPEDKSIEDLLAAVEAGTKPPPTPHELVIPTVREDSVDLASPIVQRAPQLDPPVRLPLPQAPEPPVELSSRPSSPLAGKTLPAHAGSSYASGHSESEYSVNGSVDRNSSVLNTIAGYSGLSWMRDATPSFVHLKYPSLPSEHIFEEAHITVREDEPTSIIAFTLQSPGYKAALTKTKATVKVYEKPEAFMPDNDGSLSDSQSWGVISVDGLSDAINEIKEPPIITHPVFHFGSAGVQISCTVFHAEQFDALRRSCQCEESMIESLARCLKWDATGGKSGSAFLKTRDDRFIAKELSRSELDAMSKFAPKYFEYMSNAISSKRPTLLAKIFGFYKIVYKNPDLNKTVRMTLLVMENLFYDHKHCQVYDLKGSSRNRLAQISPSKPNQVLLDENLLQNLHKSPFYIREHSKRILRSALWNDSLFLEDLNVMDYSLLVAVDPAKDEIIIGMIDYIRTYTWDKKLESWVKESTFLGGAGKGEPTIVTPKQYRTRFLNAMERYFYLVPDRWMKHPYVPDEDASW